MSRSEQRLFDLKLESVCRSLFSADDVKVEKVFMVYVPSADGEAERKEEEDVPPEEELPASNGGKKQQMSIISCRVFLSLLSNDGLCTLLVVTPIRF